LKDRGRIPASCCPKVCGLIANVIGLAEGFTIFDFPLEHRKSVRTTDSLERINKEIRRRTRVMGVFPNEISCLRLVSALLMEISEEWQIGKHYYAGKSFEC
jgi:putative transposase